MVQCAMVMSLLEHQRNQEILEEAKAEPIAMVMRRRRLEWFGHTKRRNETENTRAVVKLKPLTGKNGKIFAKPATPCRKNAGKGEGGCNSKNAIFSLLVLL